MKSTQLALLIGVALTSPVPAADFELKDGDKVVWLGSTLIEREQRYGYWETALTAAWPDRKITFRNLGWSGDNVFGQARLAFDINKPELGLRRMVDLTLAEKPTVIIICYGTNESFEGEAGLEKFEKGYEKLLDELKPAKARIVLMTPNPFEANSRSLPDPSQPNRRLGLYCDSIRKIARKRNLIVADLFKSLEKTMGNGAAGLTENGMHFTEEGYIATISNLGEALGIKKGEAAFFCNNANAPYVSSICDAIVAKNKLYFYRWRPQNETYLFGFRKHEQGKNAKEIAEFDPLIAKAEAEIDKLKKPRTHRYEIVPVEKK